MAVAQLPTTTEASSMRIEMPNHFQLLSPRDLEEYILLRHKFSDEMTKKSRKGERLDSFVAKLKDIRTYIEKGDGDDWKRSLACGIIFLEKSIAINIYHFRILLGKCKSSINGSLQQLGYVAIPSGRDMGQEILTKIPLFKKDPGELKKWTIRENQSGVERVKKQSIFFIELPKKRPVEIVHEPVAEQNSQPLKTEEIQKIVRTAYPCPIKCRYKFYDSIYRSVSIQTEV